MFRSLGAVPTPVAIGGAYLAMQMGTVDGHENPANVIESYQFNEVQKYLTLTGHVLSGQVMLMSEQFLNSLPEDLREKVLTAALETVVAIRGAALLLDAISRTELGKMGRWSITGS
jgi:TRAP-type C4-dicarboxylate transport system substrate-binding protein